MRIYLRRTPEGILAIKRLLATICVIAALAMNVVASVAEARGFIRDAEIEATLKRIARPVLAAAGLNAASIRIIIVNDPSLNAFVAGRDTIFLHTGLLTRLKTVEMIQAVIAHEAAHIRAGHQISRSSAARGSSSTVALGILLAAMAARSGNGEVAGAIAAGTARVAERQFLAHTRAEESAADQASVRILAKAGIPPTAALDTLQMFSGQDVLTDKRRDPYARTHPMNSQRISSLKTAISATRLSGTRQDPNLAYWHARMIAKFEGFLRKPGRLLKRAKQQKNVELATYMRAIAYHRQSNISAAHKEIDKLIRARPNDPYYTELKGQFYLEGGKAQQAVTQYRRALKLAPKEPQIQSALAKALLALDNGNATREAVQLLEKSRQRDLADPTTLQYLALGYARSGKPALASLATAERYALSGRIKDAAIHAKRAMGALPEGTPSWRRANDIVVLARRAGG